MAYEGHLPLNINGQIRNILICQYRQWKGDAYVPDKTDVALRWSSKDPFVSSPPLNDSPWQFVNKYTKMPINQVHQANPTVFIAAKGSQPLHSAPKHSREDLDMPTKIKRQRINVCNSNTTIRMPLCGLAWDNLNWSCAYDSLFVIFHAIWSQRPHIWTDRLKAVGNDYLSFLVDGFQQVSQNVASLEVVRDAIRHQLHISDPVQFPIGQVGTSVADLAIAMMRRKHSVSSSQVLCSKCHYEGVGRLGYVLHARRQSNCVSTAEWVESLGQQAYSSCPDCHAEASNMIIYDQPPAILILEYPNCNLNTSHIVKVNIVTGSVHLHLRGVVYHGGYHFTSCIIDENQMI